ncbi:MAG: hypothetical protein JSS49_18460 [Planctomycetes bacterium]|nr:hypothetical protein [Planctomycetota bacterium]
MSVSVMVQCPHCQAQGNLADPALFGQPISCPACQTVFVAPTPAVDTTTIATPATAVPEPVPAAGNLQSSAAEAASIGAPTGSLETTPGDVAVVDTRALDTDVLTTSNAHCESAPATELLDAPAVVQQAVEAVASIPMANPAANPSPVMLTTVAIPVPAATDTGLPQPSVAFGAAVDTPGLPISVAIPTVAAMPTGAEPSFVTAPMASQPTVPGEILPQLGPIPERPVLTIDGPLPQFLAPLPEPGLAEVSFAQSLPEPLARGNVKPPKMPSKQVQMIAIGTVSIILLVATVLFLMGDPLRTRMSKPAGSVVQPSRPAGRDESAEDVFARINALSKPGNSKSNDK